LGACMFKTFDECRVTGLLANDPNENRILLHSLLKETQEWVGLAQIDTVAHERASYTPTSVG